MSDTTTILAEGEEDLRTDSQRAVDEIVGAKGLTNLDRQFARVRKLAEDLFLNAKATRKYLSLGEEADLYVRKAVDMGLKRAEATARLTELLGEAGLGDQDIRVNDWIAVYHLARLCTGTDTVKDMPIEWVSSVAYRTLAILKVAIERDDTDYTFRPYWADKVGEWLRSGVKGSRLEAAAREHKEWVEEHVRSERMKSLSPQKQHQAEMAELARERDKAETDIRKSAEKIRETAMKVNLPPEDLLTTLVSRGIIPAPEPVHVPMESHEYARQMDSDEATKFARALIERGNVSIVMAIASVLSGWLKANAEKSAA